MNSEDTAAIDQEERRLHAKGDTLLLALVCAGLPLAIAIGAQHERVAPALWAGSIFVGLAGLLWLFARGSMLARLGMAALSMSMVALHVHVGMGDNQYHFGFFVTLAILLVYRDWRIPLAGAAVVAVHHALFNGLQEAGWGVIAFAKPGWAKVVIHATYLTVQAAVEVWIATLLAHEARRASEVHALVLDHDGSINLRASEEHASTDLARAVSRALAMMHHAVVQVKETAAEILHTSHHLERGNTDLAGRTEEQSASLEQTSASIAALAATVRGNSRSAQQAADRAVGAADVAARGGVAVREVVGTMGEIERASRKIADIIGIIDGIAFQTNILALNAAVEAARAGEHGRGFAEVAAEVRSLAQRSAAAARETKVLIDDSTARVGAGSRLAQEAGATMDEMVAAVQGVRDLIGDIAGASKQQLASIEEVSRAIARMEEVTQRNAALVQDSAEAASRMAGQSSALARAVSHFDTEAGGASHECDLDALALPVPGAGRRLLAG